MNENRSMTAGELFDQQSKDAREALEGIVATATQKDWLLITAAFDRTRHQISEDTGLVMAAGAWLREKRDHGGAKFDRFLSMTDEELAVFLGWPAGRRPDDEPADDQAGQVDQAGHDQAVVDPHE